MNRTHSVIKIVVFSSILLGNGLLSLPAWCNEIYSYVDAHGVRHYTDNRPNNRPTVKLHPQPIIQSTSNSSVKIYRFVDSKGVVHLTDYQKDSRYKLIYQGGINVPSFSASIYSGYSSRSLHKKYKNYSSLVKDVADLTDLEPALLHAVIQTESAYNPKAISPKGAVGLMQLMPATAKRFGVTDRTDASSNVYGGARYLRHLLRLFNNNLRLALAAYNAGENAVKRYGNQIPPYRETRNYVKKVMALYKSYQNNM